jgi:hypothetical protein
MTERNQKMPELHRVGGARGRSARLGRTDSVGSIGGGGGRQVGVVQLGTRQARSV